MTTTAAPTTTGRLAPADWTRKYSRAAGIFYLITFAASMPAVFYFLAPILTDPNYIVGPGADARVAMGCLLDVITALAGIGSAVAVFPVVRRQNEGLALGFVTSRMFEAAVIMIGVVSLLAVVTLRQEFAGAAGVDQSALLSSGHALVAVRDWTFQFGPNLAASINAILFGTLLYRSRLVPRAIPTLGLIGAPLLLAVTLATGLGFIPASSALFGLAVPVALWEVSVGTWMLVKGFTRSPLTAVA